MKKTVVKPQKITLCRECGGTGHIDQLGERSVVCPQCEGSGRVVVSGILELEVKAYRPHGHV